MPDTSLYIDYEGHPYPQLERLVSGSGSARLTRFLNRLRLDSDSRRNPRTAEYMDRVSAHEHRPPIVRIRGSRDLDAAKVAAAREIVLLWRDANGCGWSAIERTVLRHKHRDCFVRVINGRRRQFELTPDVRRSFRVRRAIEKSLLPEACLAILFLAASPCLVGWDALRGRIR